MPVSRKTPHADAPLTGGRRRLVIAATVLGSSLAFIDGSAVNVALPALQKGLGADAGAIEWVVNAYLLTLGALVLIGGSAGDRFGRRLVFIIGVAVFALASLACAVAPSVELLIAARAVQGVGAALLTPASLAILGASFAKQDRGSAIGAWAGFGALFSAAGPVLGGWLTDAVSWRAIFLINLPLAAGAIALSLAVVPESRDPEPRRIDWLGAVLVALGLAAVTWALTEAPARGFGDRTVLAGLGAGVVMLVGFIVQEARGKDPMTPPALFRSRTFTGANIATFLLYFALGGVLFFLPFGLIRVRGFSAAQAGASLLPFSIIMGVFSEAAGRLSARIGPRLPMSLGPILAGAGFGGLALVAAGGGFWTTVLPAICLLAVGMTVTVAPLTSTVMAAAGSDDAGVASGINNATARLAGLFAVAVLGVVFFQVFRHVLGDGGDAHALMGQAMAGRTGLQGAAGHAFRAAFVAVMLASAVCAVLAGIVSAVTIPDKVAEKA
jgi:EmrB/QacA subfamily drug resistance transporter